jgi:hypothetical protein
MGEKASNVLITSVPKCGTHLLKQVVLGAPFYKRGKWISLQKSIREQIDGCHDQTVMVGHLEYSEELVRYLNKKGIRRLFIYRDPRDMLISYVFYVKEIAPEHELRNYFLHVLGSDEERIMKLITGFHYQEENLTYGDLTLHYQPFLPWIEDKGTLALRFEDLVSSNECKEQTISRIADYLWHDSTFDQYNKEVLRKRMLENIRPSRSGTFRKGVSGDWKNYFTAQHKSVFKEVAGQLLIDLGYEKDMDW